MRGAMIKAFGEPREVLELVDVQEPGAPAAGEVLVGAEYAPVNMNDLYVIQGAFPVRPSRDPGANRRDLSSVLAARGGSSCAARRKGAPRSWRNGLSQNRRRSSSRVLAEE